MGLLGYQSKEDPFVQILFYQTGPGYYGCSLTTKYKQIHRHRLHFLAFYSQLSSLIRELIVKLERWIRSLRWASHLLFWVR